MYGSTRSINAGVASGIALHAWVLQHAPRRPDGDARCGDPTDPTDPRLWSVCDGTVLGTLRRCRVHLVSTRSAVAEREAQMTAPMFRRLFAVVALGLGMISLGACQPLFPPAPYDSGAGRRIVYSVEQQRVWLVEADEPVARSYLVSGRARTPSTGVYRVFSKSRYTTSIGGGARMEYMVRFAVGPLGRDRLPLHPGELRGVPLQSDAQLGTYQSGMRPPALERRRGAVELGAGRHTGRGGEVTDDGPPDVARGAVRARGQGGGGDRCLIGARNRFAESCTLRARTWWLRRAGAIDSSAAAELGDRVTAVAADLTVAGDRDA